MPPVAEQKMTSPKSSPPGASRLTRSSASPLPAGGPPSHGRVGVGRPTGEGVTVCILDSGVERRTRWSAA